MGSGPSSSKDQTVDTGKTTRKFESYHLPFVDRKQKKGLARLRSSLFGSKKKQQQLQQPNSYNTQYTLALLTKKDDHHPSSAPIVYSRSYSDDVHNLDYQLYYRGFEPNFNSTTTNPIHLSLCEGFVVDQNDFVDVNLNDDDEEDEGEYRRRRRISLPDEQLLNADSVIHDAYSEVIKTAIEKKKTSSLTRNKCNSNDNLHSLAQKPHFACEEWSQDEVEHSKRENEASEPIKSIEPEEKGIKSEVSTLDSSKYDKVLSELTLKQNLVSLKQPQSEIEASKSITDKAETEIKSFTTLGSPKLHIKGEISTLESAKYDKVLSELTLKQNSVPLSRPLTEVKVLKSIINESETEVKPFMTLGSPKLRVNGRNEGLNVLNITKEAVSLTDLQLESDNEPSKGLKSTSRNIVSSTEPLGSPDEHLNRPRDDQVSVETSIENEKQVIGSKSDASKGILQKTESSQALDSSVQDVEFLEASERLIQGKLSSELPVRPYRDSSKSPSSLKRGLISTTNESDSVKETSEPYKIVGSSKQRLDVSEHNQVASKVIKEDDLWTESKADYKRGSESTKQVTNSSQRSTFSPKPSRSSQQRPLLTKLIENKLPVEEIGGFDEKSIIERSSDLNSTEVLIVETAETLNIDPSSFDSFDRDEGKALLQEIAEKEQSLSEKLSKVQSLWLNSGVRRGSDISDSSGERSGSVGEEDMAVCGSNSDVVESGMSSVDSPWEEIDDGGVGTVEGAGANAVESKPLTKDVVFDPNEYDGYDTIKMDESLNSNSKESTNESPKEKIEQKFENTSKSIISDFVSPTSAVSNDVKMESLGSRSWIHSSGFVSDFGAANLAAHRQSSPGSSVSSRDEKRSESGSSCYSYFVGGQRLPRNAEDITSKLVRDLMTNLEVDLGDFQEFLNVDVALEEKYKLLDVETLLRDNLKVGIGEDELSRCLRVLAKYGLNLLKPESERPKYWKKVVTMPRGADGTVHWLSNKGFKQVLFYFGYREVGKDFVYDNAAKVEDGFVARYVVELLLAAYELNACSVGSHPRSHIFTAVDVGGEHRVTSGEMLSTEARTDPIYQNTPSVSACQQKSPAESAAETSEMFGRRTIVPWLSDKENHVVPKEVIQCGLCGSSSPAVRCEKCSNLNFCLSCDDMYHRHPKRHDHVRKVVNANPAPPPPPPRPPPKITDPNKLPVPPPRRKKSQRSTPSSPVFGRKPIDEKPELPKKQFPLKFGSLKRFMPSGLGRQPQTHMKESMSRSPVGPWPPDNSPHFSNEPSKPSGCSYDNSGRTHDAHFNQRKNSYRSEGQGSSAFQHKKHGQIEGFPSYYDRMSNTADPSSSEAEEEVRSGLGSGGSGSRDRDDDWSRSMPSLPPAYGGMTPRLANNTHEQRPMYPNPNMGYSTLNRRNTMMSAYMGRSSPFGYAKPMQYMQQQHSNSVCDLSNPMMHPSGLVGYPFPQVQSMADLHRGEMEGIPMTAPCGCRHSWVGPDSFGMWHPPVRCMIHGSATSLYPGGAGGCDSTLKHVPGHQYVPSPSYPSEGMFQDHHVHPRMFNVVATSQNSFNPIPSASPPLPSRPSSVTAPPQPSVSPTNSARSPEIRRKSKSSSRNNSNNNAETVREGGTRNFRSRNQRTKGNIATSSEEDDYFSAGESDEEPNGDGGTLRSVGRTRNNNTRVLDGSWECEHCTFVNSAGTRICDVCCKTSSVKTRSSDKRRNKTVSDVVSVVRDSSEKTLVKKNTRSNTSKDEGIYEDLSDAKAAANGNNAEETKVLPGKLETGFRLQDQVDQKPAEVTMKASKEVKVMEQQTDTNESGPNFQDLKLETSKDFNEKSQNIIPEVKAETKASVQMVKTTISEPNGKSVISTGTSPPPQSISTQTPNEPLWTMEEPLLQHPTTTTGIQRTSSRLSLSGDAPELRAPFAQQSSLLKRATSLHFSGTPADPTWDRSTSNTGFMYRAGSRTSLMSDHPFGFSSGPPSRDPSPPRNYLSRRDSERAYPGYSRFGHKEDHGFLSRSGSRKDYYLSLEELVERRRHESMRTQGLELVRLLREAEQHNFTADDLQVAMNHCGSQNPIQWLNDNWRNMVDTVVTLATNYGHDKKENDVGIVSNTEAKEALRIHKGNIWAAVTECVEQRQRKFIELQNQGNYSREEVVAALTSNQGSVEAAINDLNKSTLKPLLMRIWGPPAGVENEAGSVTWPRFQPSRNNDADLIEVDKSPTRQVYEEYSRNHSSDDQLFLSSEHLAEDSDLQRELYESEDSEEQEEESVENEEEYEDEETKEYDRETEVIIAKDEVYYDAIPGSPVVEIPLRDSVPLEPTVKSTDTDSSSATKQINDVAVVTPPPPRNVSNELEVVSNRTLTPTKLQHEAPSMEPKDSGSSKAVSISRYSPDDISYQRETSSPRLTGVGLSLKRSSDSTVVKGQQKRAEISSALSTEYDRRVRQLLAEGKMEVYEKAEVAVKLLDLKFEESEAIYAANECSDLYMAVSYLQQNCELCAGRFPMGKMISMLFCIHRCCRSCAKEYFTIKIKERNIMEAVCPFCDEPDLSDDDIATEYFNNLDIMLKNLVERDVHELFQCKLRDRALMSDPNFHWCAACESGFIAEPNRRRLVCPDCQAVTCALCKKPWEWQHDGIPCEKFAQWKEANDPEYQAVGLEKYLAENGIDCPKCKFKYALAKGGCMHFTCSQCKFEFCSGCGKPFLMSKKCNVSAHCEKLGLHAHHPRNCLFYLRDKEPNELQKLLTDNGINYDTVATYSHFEGHDSRKCPVMEQKELPDGNEDAFCGREIEEGHAGLCRLHYVEYLVSLVNKNRVDPLNIMDVNGLQQELRRAEKVFPEQKQTESDDGYHERLVQVILREIPLVQES